MRCRQPAPIVRSPPTARGAHCGSLCPTNSATLPSPNSSNLSTCSPPRSRTAATAGCGATTPSQREHGQFHRPPTTSAAVHQDLGDDDAAARDGAGDQNGRYPACPPRRSIRPPHRPPPDVGNPCRPGITLAARDSPPTRSRHSHLPDCGHQHLVAAARDTARGRQPRGECIPPASQATASLPPAVAPPRWRPRPPVHARCPPVANVHRCAPRHRSPPPPRLRTITRMLSAESASVLLWPPRNARRNSGPVVCPATVR